MRIINDGDIEREYNTRDLIELFQDEVLDVHKSEVDDWEADLMISQYSYVKFGLLLEQVRNGSWWNRCKEKFYDFRQFCQKKINLNIWQVANAIKSAKVAVNLAFLGFEEFPRNASQALKLADLSIDRLGEVWGNILKKCEGHKITADAIAKEINPEVQSVNATIRIPVTLLDKLQQQAIDCEMTLDEYLEMLVNERIAADNKVEPTENPTPFDVRDHLHDYDTQVQAIEPKPVSIAPKPVVIAPVEIIKSVGSSIDRMRQAMYDRYLPKWKREVCHE